MIVHRLNHLNLRCGAFYTYATSWTTTAGAIVDKSQVWQAGNLATWTPQIFVDNLTQNGRITPFQELRHYEELLLFLL